MNESKTSCIQKEVPDSAHNPRLFWTLVCCLLHPGADFSWYQGLNTNVLANILNNWQVEVPYRYHNQWIVDVERRLLWTSTKAGNNQAERVATSNSTTDSLANQLGTINDLSTQHTSNINFEVVGWITGYDDGSCHEPIIWDLNLSNQHEGGEDYTIFKEGLDTSE